jgi:hypothetical protein
MQRSQSFRNILNTSGECSAPTAILPRSPQLYQNGGIINLGKTEVAGGQGRRVECVWKTVLLFLANKIVVKTEM